jgi:[glutamine synthetase] adenylyltransferase / [glutamine synthetase]-adenylyl-L-tyrosine phosphorylase
MTLPNVKDLLLAERLNPLQVAELLGPYGLKDIPKADRNLQSLASDPVDRVILADMLENLLNGISQSADPDQALTYFERFAQAALKKTSLFTYLRDAPRMMDVLATTLGASRYMAEILIRDPQHFYWLTDPEILERQRRKREIERDVLQAFRALTGEMAQLDYLRVLKRREMLRIGVRDLLRLCTVEETLASLSILAEVLISAVYWVSASALRREYGLSGQVFTDFTVLAMGKLGGGELNFSSDVDLIYLYSSDAEQSESVSPREYFRRLCQKITLGLSQFSSEGYIYRVDLRLRPEGSGDLAYPLDGYRRYYTSRVGTWERLALLKAWPVAGNRTLGRAFLEMAGEFIYDKPFDVTALEDVRNMKRRINQQMNSRGQSGRNVKLGTGGIREIELIAQSLQVRHGRHLPQIRLRTTLTALATLCEQSLMSADECDALTRAYVFLRDVENKLQMTNDAQTHSLPVEQEELTTLARMLRYDSTRSFLNDYQRHTGEVNRIFDARILSGQQ